MKTIVIIKAKELLMKAMCLKDLSNINVTFVDEDQLLKWNYICDKDLQEESHCYKILERVYKKKPELTGEPSIVIVIMGVIVHKIWIEKGRVSRSDGHPADIMYNENGVSSINWYINGKCINDYISFICLKYKKSRSLINKKDIDFIKDYFKIK
jgi:hypothetical protein